MTHLSRKQYSEAETSEILQRALELQQSSTIEHRSSARLTRSDLEQVASEAEIQPHHLDRAMQEVFTDRSEVAKLWLGSPLTLVVDRALPLDLSHRAMSQLSSDIERILGMSGQAHVANRSLAWNNSSHHRDIYVSVTSRDEQLCVEAGEVLAVSAMRTFALMTSFVLGTGVFGLFFGVLNLKAPIATVILLVSFVGVSFITARNIFRWTYRRRKRELKQLVGELVAIVEQYGSKE